MTRSLSRRLRPLAQWTRALPLGLALSASAPLVACNSNPLSSPPPAPERQAGNTIELNQVRDVDILFMVDNSNSMADEQAKLRDEFPKFMKQLRDIEGGLPNVNIAVVTSDFGSGFNDVCTPKVFNDMGQGFYWGDRGLFQTSNRVGPTPATEQRQPCGIPANGEKWIRSYNNETETNLGNRQLEDVFTCMATQGINGCGFEHQLLSVQTALTAPEQQGFLRPDAYLAIILITDEDDCSIADLKDADFFKIRMPNRFGDDDKTEVESFRCSKHGHRCGNQTPVNGMNASLADCEAVDSGPLAKVENIVNTIKALKGGRAEKIFVSAIMGWPQPPATAEAARYQVGPSPTQGNRTDVRAVCTSPIAGSSEVSEAFPGLRIKKFVESFQQGGLHSICANDFSAALTQIGQELAERIQNQCISANLEMNGVDPICVVEENRPGQRPQTVPACKGGNADPCWIYTAASGNTCQRIDIMRSGDAPQGTTVTTRCAVR